MIEKNSEPRKLSIQAQLEKPTTKQPQKTEEAALEKYPNGSPSGAAAARVLASGKAPRALMYLSVCHD
jgi:hypothetical protein